MIETEAIILRTIKYRESSLIFDAYSQSDGLLSLIIGGVRKKSAKISAGMLQVGNIVKLIAYPSKGSLARVKDLQMSHVYQTIMTDIAKISVLNFYIEVFRKSVKENEESVGLYQFLHEKLLSLDENDHLSHTANIYMIELSRLIGFGPNLQEGHLAFDLREGHSLGHEVVGQDYISEEVYQYFESLSTSPRDILPNGIAKTTRSSLTDKLIRYYRNHIESFGELKSLSILRALGSS